MKKQALYDAVQKADKILRAIDVEKSTRFSAYNLVKEQYDNIKALQKQKVPLKSIHASLQDVEGFTIPLNTLIVYLSRIKRARKETREENGSC